jgi:hypothetical protein
MKALSWVCDWLGWVLVELADFTTAFDATEFSWPQARAYRAGCYFYGLGMKLCPEAYEFVEDEQRPPLDNP